MIVESNHKKGPWACPWAYPWPAPSSIVPPKTVYAYSNSQKILAQISQAYLAHTTLIKHQIHSPPAQQRTLRINPLPVVRIQTRLARCQHGGPGPRHDSILVPIESGSNVVGTGPVAGQLGQDQLDKVQYIYYRVVGAFASVCFGLPISCSQRIEHT